MITGKYAPPGVRGGGDGGGGEGGGGNGGGGDGASIGSLSTVVVDVTTGTPNDAESAVVVFDRVEVTCEALSTLSTSTFACTTVEPATTLMIIHSLSLETFVRAERFDRNAS